MPMQAPKSFRRYIVDLVEIALGIALASSVYFVAYLAFSLT